MYRWAIDIAAWAGRMAGDLGFSRLAGAGRMARYSSCSWLAGAAVVAALCSGLAMATPAGGQTIVLNERDAVLWTRDHQVNGSITGASSGVLHHTGTPLPFDAAGEAFSVDVVLNEGENVFVACTDDLAVCSDTLRWTLGYSLRPEVLAWAEVTGRTVQLMSEVLENPAGTLDLEWRPDPDNPQPTTLSATSGAATSLTLPDDAAQGEYYFDLMVSSGASDPVRARTFVTVGPDGIRPFDIETDHSSWVDRAVVYEIAPWYFGRYWRRQQLRMIKDKIPEIASLGVSAIWLQPVTQSHGGGQAYDVTDYFSVWDEIGTEEDLHDLVETAHAHGLKVLLDLVLNHTSIFHPYARDAAEHGATSYYFDFYQRVPDSAPYSNNYTSVRDGRMTFLTYFWPELVIFNYSDPAAQRYVTEASRYWIEEFDIDGYRFDAVWGLHARNPSFAKALRRTLKRIKPEILMLAEAKAPYSAAFPDGFPSIFENFDAAYDWTDSGWCISYWAWAGECLYSAYEGGDQNSLFNSGAESQRGAALRSALSNGGRGFPAGAKILRFLENNDVPRFRAHHSLDATRMAAALMFSLPGIPMLYYGQESGITTQWPTISPLRTMQSYDTEGFWAYYRYLIDLRESFPSLWSDDFEEVGVSSESVGAQSFAYHRWDGAGEHLVGFVNMGSTSVEAVLDVSSAAPGADPEATYFLTDLLSGDVVQTSGGELGAVPVQLPPTAAALYAVADSALSVTVPTATQRRPAPAQAELARNYPNPFRSETTIEFALDRPADVRLRVYDVLGRMVAELLNEVRLAGRHRVRFLPGHLPSGTYLYRLDAGDQTFSRTMTRVR